ncbi:MAG TPA: HAD family hydrolase, partial [Acidimicrobiales bacterium]|nr:HAD family hydrolase [Acidimicrobiales bacterium]
MGEHLILWDVDGTLLRAGDIGAAVFDDAVEAVLGRRPPERIRMSGKTDPLIVSEYLDMLGIERRPELVERVLADLEAGLARASAAGVLQAEGAACGGVPELLAELDAAEGVVQSLLTGNVYANAVVKVTAYGLDKWLDLEIGAYGSDSMDRNQLVPIALERVERLRGMTVRPSDTWIIGDTPRDLACARGGRRQVPARRHRALHLRRVGGHRGGRGVRRSVRHR